MRSELLAVCRWAMTLAIPLVWSLFLLIQNSNICFAGQKLVLLVKHLWTARKHCKCINLAGNRITRCHVLLKFLKSCVHKLLLVLQMLSQVWVLAEAKGRMQERILASFRGRPIFNAIPYFSRPYTLWYLLRQGRTGFNLFVSLVLSLLSGISPRLTSVANLKGQCPPKQATPCNALWISESHQDSAIQKNYRERERTVLKNAQKKKRSLLE